MGYEIKLIIGRASVLANDEIKRDMTKPFSDGSGYEYAKDDKGAVILTGRKEHWFQVYAILDLCKLGYDDNDLNRLISASHTVGKLEAKETFHYFYADDGDTQIEQDRYDAHMWPVSIADALRAMKASQSPTDPYCRLTWAIALLESMKDDPRGLSVMFYGH